MTELERLLTAQFERMEQRHQDETKALREQRSTRNCALWKLTGAVAEHFGRVRDALRQHTPPSWPWEEYQERASQHGPEFGPDQPGYRSSAWVIEQQCEHSQKLAGELEQGAALIADRAAELRKEQRRDRGLSM